MVGYRSPQAEVIARVTRRLPVEGEVVVSTGDAVEPGDVIARATREGPPVVLMVGQALGVPPKNVTRLLRRWAGEPVKRDETLAQKKGLLFLRGKTFRSPIDGVVLSGPHAEGEVVIGRQGEEVLLLAGVPGRVAAVLPGRGAIIETAATWVPGVGGYGRDTSGPLRLPLETAEREITPDVLGDNALGSVLVGGYVGRDGLVQAAESGAAALVVGGISAEGYLWLLAIRPSMAVVVTAGGGRRPMSAATFEMLRRRAGSSAYVLAAPDGGAPELIVPLPAAASGAKSPPELAPGQPVLVMAGPWAGREGRVLDLPLLPRRLPSGLVTPVAEVALEGEGTVTAARANLAPLP